MKSETPHIIQMMKATGNQPGIIQRWKDDLAQWASTRNPKDPDIAAILAFVPLWQVRPFYTAEELAPMWPALAIATGYTMHWPAVLKSAKRLEHELDFFGLPRLSDFEYREFFICERLHHWRNAHYTEIRREFENAQR